MKKIANSALLIILIFLLSIIIAACEKPQQKSITFNMQNGENPILLDTDQEAIDTNDFPDTPSREGYTFAGWYLDMDSKDTEITSGYPLTGDITVYAHWTVNQYTITFNSNGGSDVTAITSNYGEAIAAPIVPTRENYTFLGWYTDDGTFQNEYSFINMPAENLSLYANWQEIEIDLSQFVFVLINGDTEYSVSSLDTEATTIEIPSTYQGLPVTKIADTGFAEFTAMTSITIPDSITVIGENAFTSCSALTSVTLPSNLLTLSYCAFFYCTSLTSIVIPDSVTSIGGSAFNNCISLASVTLPSGLSIIQERVFMECSSLTSIDLPNVTSIGERAFNGCTSLTNVTIPSSVTSLGWGVFYNCTALEEVTMNPTVPPLCTSGLFSGFPVNFTIYVPEPSETEYREASIWKNYAAYIDVE